MYLERGTWHLQKMVAGIVIGNNHTIHLGICDICSFGKGGTVLKCEQETKFQFFMVLA